MSTTADETSKLMTVPELAEYLGVPVGTLYAWRTNGAGPRGLKVGRHIRYRREDVESWLELRADGGWPG